MKSFEGENQRRQHCLLVPGHVENDISLACGGYGFVLNQLRALWSAEGMREKRNAKGHICR